ncbi:hypothetical protein S245_045253, partial [Arachis hypogaea]
MKKGVHIVYVPRRSVIDEDALVRAFDDRIVAQTTLDVVNIKEAQEGVAIGIAEAMLGALKGELSSTVVNVSMVPLWYSQNWLPMWCSWRTVVGVVGVVL